ncbi:hypothetical protein [Geomicrobium sp. JCM 19039]|uniref:hypothetical protein n=1 Tax=Geomicrobium sp. JCM 19039 TaxID=1460636 RepID=UPI00045F4A27|nr:hypothetical protein [Geomicrobium sp. JCM 19039]GAK11360.1 hypothetical protein JCM19039_1050 [Geomicrobium sp. JCM 19039]
MSEDAKQMLANDIVSLLKNSPITVSEAKEALDAAKDQLESITVIGYKRGFKPSEK